jgi:16S rRNA processing protein RimM
MMDEIAIGAVRTTHGVRGYLKVRSFSGDFGHFYDLKEITLKNGNRTRRFEVESVKPLGDQIIMKLKGLDTPEAGKSYSNWEIWVSRDEAAPLEEGEFYHADLNGCTVLLDRRPVGKVRSILDGGGGDLLEVAMDDGENKLIPFNPVFIGRIDTDKKEIELLEGWILD